MKKILDLGLTYKEIVILILTVIVGLIPTIYDIKTERRHKKRLTRSGIVFLFFTGVLFLFTAYGLYADKQKILPNDLRIVVQLNANGFYPDNNELADKLKKNTIVFIPRIQFGEAQTSGSFQLQNIQYAKARGTPFPIIVYKCSDINTDDIKYFPQTLSDLQGIEVKLKFPIEWFDKKEYSFINFPRLLIKDKEYTGILGNDGEMKFTIED